MEREHHCSMTDGQYRFIGRRTIGDGHKETTPLIPNRSQTRWTEAATESPALRYAACRHCLRPKARAVSKLSTPLSSPLCVPPPLPAPLPDSRVVWWRAGVIYRGQLGVLPCMLVPACNTMWKTIARNGELPLRAPPELLTSENRAGRCNTGKGKPMQRERAFTAHGEERRPLLCAACVGSGRCLVEARSQLARLVAFARWIDMDRRRVATSLATDGEIRARTLAAWADLPPGRPGYSFLVSIPERDWIVAGASLVGGRRGLGLGPGAGVCRTGDDSGARRKQQ